VHFKNFSTALTPIGERLLRVVFSDETVDEEGWVIVQSGISTKKFVRNPVFLLWHDPAKPGGTVSEIRPDPLGSTALITMAPSGVSPDVDNAWGLIQAGILKSISWGFDVLQAEPMDAARPRGPLRVLRSEMREISIVSIPANMNAGVLAASNAKGAQFGTPEAEAERAARIAHAAEVTRGSRQLRALELTRIGREQEARHKAAEPPPLTADQRRAKARALTRAGMTEQERRIADLPPGRERYEAEREIHASKAAAGLAAKDWNTNASAEVRQAKGREVARKTRLAGW
jgi:HK97 family phage prohead protease